jgi:hypothetical protein
MWISLIFLFVVLIVSLLSYISDEEVRSFRDECAKLIYKNRERDYGYHTVNYKSAFVVLGTIITLFSLIFLSWFGKEIFENFEGELIPEEFNQKLASYKFAVAEDKVELPPNVYNENGNNGDGLQKSQDGADSPSSNSEVTNNRTKDFVKSQQKPNETLEEAKMRLENEMYDTSSGRAYRDKLKKEAEEKTT